MFKQQTNVLLFPFSAHKWSVSDLFGDRVNVAMLIVVGDCGLDQSDLATLTLTCVGPRLTSINSMMDATNRVKEMKSQQDVGISHQVMQCECRHGDKKHKPRRLTSNPTTWKRKHYSCRQLRLMDLCSWQNEPPKPTQCQWRTWKFRLIVFSLRRIWANHQSVPKQSVFSFN